MGSFGPILRPGLIAVRNMQIGLKILCLLLNMYLKRLHSNKHLSTQDVFFPDPLLAAQGFSLLMAIANCNSGVKSISHVAGKLHFNETLSWSEAVSFWTHNEH